MIDPNVLEVPAIPDRAVTVLVVAGTTYSDAVSKFISDARMQHAAIRPFADVYEEYTGKVAIAHVADVWNVPMALQAKPGYLLIKRLADIVGTLLVAPPAILLMAAAAVAVKLNSPGTVFVQQRRVGEGGRVFTIHKIRTMTGRDDGTTDQTTDEDSERITRVGSILRKLHIDEIPQLWNVIKGDLSIVGPRPEQVALVQGYEAEIPFYSERHIVRSGMTGWAQVHHGYAQGVEETIEKLGYDLFYIKHMSAWLDLRILGRSVWAVLTGFGAK